MNSVNYGEGMIMNVGNGNGSGSGDGDGMAALESRITPLDSRVVVEGNAGRMSLAEFAQRHKFTPEKYQVHMVESMEEAKKLVMIKTRRRK